PLICIWPAASRLTAIVLSRPSPRTVSTPVPAEKTAVTAGMMRSSKGSKDGLKHSGRLCFRTGLRRGSNIRRTICFQYSRNMASLQNACDTFRVPTHATRKLQEQGHEFPASQVDRTEILQPDRGSLFFERVPLVVSLCTLVAMSLSSS